MAAKPIQHWLMKSEPDVYSIDDLARDRRTAWTGVRNYQARNFMRDAMRVGDLVFFYHSNAKPSGIAGLARVASEAYADPLQFDAQSEYHDPRATRDRPIWMLVDLVFEKKCRHLLSLDALKADPHLSGLLLLKQGQRLSVQPVSAEHGNRLMKWAAG